MKVISVIGYSGSGKTYLIFNAIKLLKKNLDLSSSVLKNIHKHSVDTPGKDSYIFSNAGAQYSIVRNKYNKSVIFINQEITIETIIKWIEKGPLETDVIFLEGFRNLDYPTILCVKDLKDIKEQFNDNIKMISGMIFTKKNEITADLKIPIINIDKHFNDFIEIFKFI